jgi:tetratricopeptide (TPR) repeat protein
MGKKKTVSKTNPESIKEAGNKAFGLGSFEEAIKLYTQAIELQASHIYYSNRANAYLELSQYLSAIEDCDMAIKIEPKFAKAYLRKGNALMNLVRTQEAINCI